MNSLNLKNLNNKHVAYKDNITDRKYISDKYLHEFCIVDNAYQSLRLLKKELRLIKSKY